MRDAASTAELPSLTEASARSPRAIAAVQSAPVIAACVSLADRRQIYDAFSEMDLRTRAAVAAQLKIMRLRAGLSQRDIYLATGIQRPVVSMLERGEQCPTIHVAQRFASACGGSLLDVLAAIDLVRDRVGAP
jgi:predicted XRE-type DNA-binding protein